MAEGIIVSIAGKIIDCLVPQALQNLGKFWGVEHELEVLKGTVSSLRAILEDEEKQYDQSHQIRDLLDKLKDILYDARDVFEEFNIEAMRRQLRGHKKMIQEVRTFFSNSNQLAFKLKMSCEIRALRERIKAIKDDKEFHLVERSENSQAEREQREREETHSFIPEGNIIGRGDDKKMVMEFLLDPNVKEDVSILPIVGIGGLGKTALAQFVYNDEMTNKQFHLKIWVCVSNGFDLKKIVTNIIACAKKKAPREVAMEQLQNELRATIDGKRYLLVLDDLWNQEPEKWLSLKNLLVGGARGSKILITTRLPSVAEITGTTLPHHLESLSESASFDLLMQMAHQKEEDIQDLEMLAIVKEIVGKCYGVPLVVRTVGHLLSFKKTKSEWLCFKDKELPNVSQGEDRVNSILRLSYNHLPSHLKRCFAFCSLFPKDYEIKKQTLVDLWMAEGFILPLDRSQHLEDIGHGYFMDLLWSNFFQDFKKDPLTNEETCKMHDLMHNLAYSVARTEYWVASNTKSIDEKTRHISHGLTSSLMGELQNPCLKTSALRTFLSTIAPRHVPWEMETREPSSEVDLHQLIQSFKRLRVLDLHTTHVEKVPRSIYKLKYLTYLDLSGNKALKRLPNSITRLQNLQTLNLRGCSKLEELPRGIRKLVSLRNLDIYCCRELSYVPRGLGQLSSLHRLTRFILPKVKTLAKNCCKLGELNGLNDIRGSLRIDNLGSVTNAEEESKAANLIGKHSLESLALDWGNFDIDDAIIGNRDEALLDGLRPPSNLLELRIINYKGENFPRWMTNSKSLPNLVGLGLWDCRCKQFPQLGFINLKRLSIKLDSLECLPAECLKSLTSLEELSISFCHRLTLLSPNMRHLSNIVNLTIHDCEELDLCKDQSSNALDFQGLHKLRSVKFARLPKLASLPRWLLQASNLECLDISQCISLKDIPEQIETLQSLQRLEIFWCRSLTSLPKGMGRLASLTDLHIRNCKELDLCKGESGNIVLDFQGLESLRSMVIIGLPRLAFLPQWLLQLSNLECLTVAYCYNLKALSEHIDALQSLKELHIRNCPSLTSLPEGMRRLASLTHLQIYCCPELEQRCKRDAGEDWDKISHIPNIELGWWIVP